MRRIPAILVLFVCLTASAAEVIPPAPQNHFNDFAGVVSAASSAKLNSQLADFERQTSNQIVVAVFPKLPPNSELLDYTVRVFAAWKPGQKDKSNGAILFVFVQDRQIHINTGYGLEGALPDALCNRIIDEEIRPRFREGNFEAGLTAGVQAMMAAVRGEYKGTGRTVRQVVRNTGAGGFVTFLIIFLIMVLIRRSTTYGGYGRRRGWYWGPGGYYGGWGGGWGGGGGSWGGGGGGGGGTFMGGGGSTGGGGAGGSW